MIEFDDIRPYRDDEVRLVLDRLATETEFTETLLRVKFPRLSKTIPWLMRPIIHRILKREFAGYNSVADLQNAVGEHLEALLKRVSTGFTVSGLDRLDPDQAYLFISNHRDIAMDPALVNLALHRDGRDTVRIAIGDNLLSKRFAADLMRLNKSFIVRRSLSSRREKVEALTLLSRYIRHSVCKDKSCIWIAQREGRAKNGIDRTEPALIKMLSLSRDKTQSFAEGMAPLNLVPVSISYELDPCDVAKAHELHAKQTQGVYKKAEHEDLLSIYKGIVGEKGHIHVAFGDVLRGQESADSLAEAIDRQVIGNYRLYPTNFVAWEILNGSDPTMASTETALKVDAWRAALTCNWARERALFTQRFAEVPEAEQRLILQMYANPVNSRLALEGNGGSMFGVQR